MDSLVFCVIPVFSDWVGILGLGIGTVGLVLTLFTFWKVKTIQAVVAMMQRKHLFAVRVPEHVKELKLIASRVLAWKLKPPKDADFHLVAESLAKTRNICVSIKEYCESDAVFSRQFDTLNELEDLVSSLSGRKGTKLRNKDWNDWYVKLRESTNKIDIFLKDQEARLP
ncbi:MAG: hypothetical protein FWC43_06840 [Planctomycetaceae bacterium]|nr:hypothetical protein [Planctomycetaceae bacterium]